MNNVAMLIVRTSVLPLELTAYQDSNSALESIKLMKLAMLRIRRNMRLIMKEITYSSTKENIGDGRTRREGESSRAKNLLDDITTRDEMTISYTGPR